MCVLTNIVVVGKDPIPTGTSVAKPSPESPPESPAEPSPLAESSLAESSPQSSLTSGATKASLESPPESPTKSLAKSHPESSPQSSASSKTMSSTDLEITIGNLLQSMLKDRDTELPLEYIHTYIRLDIVGYGVHTGVVTSIFCNKSQSWRKSMKSKYIVALDDESVRRYDLQTIKRGIQQFDDYSRGFQEPDSSENNKIVGSIVLKTTTHAMEYTSERGWAQVDGMVLANKQADPTYHLQGRVIGPSVQAGYPCLWVDGSKIFMTKDEISKLQSQVDGSKTLMTKNAYIIPTNKVQSKAKGIEANNAFANQLKKWTVQATKVSKERGELPQRQKKKHQSIAKRRKTHLTQLLEVFWYTNQDASDEKIMQFVQKHAEIHTGWEVATIKHWLKLKQQQQTPTLRAGDAEEESQLANAIGKSLNDISLMDKRQAMIKLQEDFPLQCVVKLNPDFVFREHKDVMNAQLQEYGNKEVVGVVVAHAWCGPRWSGDGEQGRVKVRLTTLSKFKDQEPLEVVYPPSAAACHSEVCMELLTLEEAYKWSPKQM